MSILCALGRHDGYWTYADPQDRHSCRQFRLCQRAGCNATEERVGHDFQVPPDGRVRYLNDDNCYAQGACTRCGVYGGFFPREMHAWADYQFDWNSDGQRIKIRSCNHCPAVQEVVAVYVD